MSTRTFVLRRAVAADRAAVTDLLERSYSQLMRGHYSVAALNQALPLIALANPGLLASGRYHLAVADDGTPIGAGGWSVAQPGSVARRAGLGHWRHFATDPAWLGMGVGAAIHTACLDDACVLGLRRLEVFASMNAEGFYARMGFKQTRHLALDLGAGVTFDAVAMRRLCREL